MTGPALEYFEDDGQFPNSRFPLLLYSGAVDRPSPEAMERLFARNGWPPAMPRCASAGRTGGSSVWRRATWW